MVRKNAGTALGVFCCLAAVSINLLPQAQASPLESSPDSGTVITVYDGDTVKIRFSDGREQRVRLIGVDAPEIDDCRESVALWAHLAKRFVFFYLYGKKVELTYDFQLLDKHDRVLAYIGTEAQGLFNEFLIREGFAYALMAFPFRTDYQERFRSAQQEARKQKRGLWRKGEPIVIPAASARSHLGEVLSVRFTCAEVKDKRSFVYLISADGDFEALIPRDRRALFSSPELYLGRVLRATGFLEEYRGRLQVMLFFPRQLDIK